MNPDRTFLILDDDKDTRFLTRHALERAFPRAIVIECESTEAALRSAEGRTFDGVITDHHLGARGGDEFVRELRARGVRCPIVMVTASCDPKTFQRAYDAGAAHVFADEDYDIVGFFRARFSAEAT